MYDKIQEAKHTMQKAAALMDFGYAPGEPVVGMTDTPVQPSVLHNHAIEQEVSSFGQGSGPGTADAAKDSVDTKAKSLTPKPATIKSDKSPISTSEGKDSPATIRVGEGSVEAIGSILNILKQLNI